MSLTYEMEQKSQPKSRRAKYVEPKNVVELPLHKLLRYRNRSLDGIQGSFLDKPDMQSIFCAGSVELLEAPTVAVIGSRSVSEAGRARARRIARLLSDNGVVVSSGLAKGVDTAAHTGAISAGGRTIAVIGTPLNKSYPAENARIQEKIYTEHLLLSQFPEGQRTYPSDFPKRNRIMAALSDASIIVEASDSSGTLHQAAECDRLGRWLFIMKSVVDNPALEWPAKFLKRDRVAVLESVDDVLDRIL
ncbi:MAG: DNA-processing protein DprA [Pseudomonadota bacterium]